MAVKPLPKWAMQRHAKLWKIIEEEKDYLKCKPL